MLNPFNPAIDHITTTIVTWWHAHPSEGLLAAALLAAVITAAALAITATDNRRAAVAVDDRLLDRLGSATPGAPESELDELALAWRAELEAPAMPELVDTDTAIATIKAGAL